MIVVAFWSGAGDGFLSTPEPRWRRLHLPGFAAIEDNYPPAVRARLAQLLSQRSDEGLPGRLALWHGPPGTGKTWALRALGREWSEWCDLHYITDPERLLGGDTGYMLSVLASRSEPLKLDLDDDEEPSEQDRKPDERWRLLVLEDAGELLGMAAVEFVPMRATEAAEWLASRGLERELDAPATIAELHAMLVGRRVDEVSTATETGFGFSVASRQ